MKPIITLLTWLNHIIAYWMKMPTSCCPRTKWIVLHRKPLQTLREFHLFVIQFLQQRSVSRKK